MDYFENIYRGRRVLITGNTGFKGSWLSLWLKQLGAEVAGFSLDIPTSPSNYVLLGLDNLSHTYWGDVRDKARLAEVIDEFKPEVIFHLAAQALVRRSHIDPVSTFETNTMGMVNLLECLRTRSFVEVAVLITSDKAYRNDEWCWGYRENDPLGGYDPYSGSKSCAELVAHSYFHSFLIHGSTRIATTRAGNVIGGGDWSEDRVVPDCIRAWSKGLPVSIRSPRATRPWQHVLEPLSGYLSLGAQLWQKRGQLNGEAFNFGPDARVNQSVGELLTAMIPHWAGARWIIPDGCQEGGNEASLLKLSCDKALQYLNWHAVLDFSETVSLTVDWYHAWYEGNQNLNSYTISQIEQYCQLAEMRRLHWVN